MSENSEYQKAWRKANSDRIKEYKRRKREKTNAWQRDRYANNQEAKKKSLAASVAWKLANPTNARAYWLKKYYWPNLTKDEALLEYQKLLNSQEHRCAICKTHQGELTNFLHVDHDHSTGKVRGLLCLSCNRAIGLLKDNPESAINAASYLRKYNEQTMS